MDQQSRDYLDGSFQIDIKLTELPNKNYRASTPYFEGFVVEHPDPAEAVNRLQDKLQAAMVSGELAPRDISN